jgi:hypothetical protein
MKKWLGLGCALGASIILAATAWFLLSHDSKPIPRQYRKGLHFTLYYPAHLSSGYSVDLNSFQRQGDVLIFSIKAPNGKNVAVSEQAVPSDAPAHQTSPAPIKIPGEKHFTTGVGSATISLWGKKYVSDIITDQTWIILNVTGFTVDEATTVTQSFTKL